MAIQSMTRSVLRTEELLTLSVEQYHRMIAQGILDEDEPIELLDGLLVVRDRGEGMTVNPRHASLLDHLLASLAPLLAGTGCFLRLQNPVTLPPADEPQPDAAIVRGKPSDFAARHPGPRDVLCVVEVADSSLERDRTVKVRVYAGAAIGLYLLVNLVDRSVEAYEEPDPGFRRYRSVRRLSPGDAVALSLDDRRTLEIPVSAILA